MNSFGRRTIKIDNDKKLRSNSEKKIHFENYSFQYYVTLDAVFYCYQEEIPLTRTGTEITWNRYLSFFFLTKNRNRTGTSKFKGFQSLLQILIGKIGVIKHEKINF